MKLKTLAAAALALAASQAFADIRVNTLGTSELVFVLGNDKGSFALDTGLSLNDLKSASFSSYIKDITNLTGFSSVASAGGAAPMWALAVYDGTGTAGFGQVEIVSTFNSALPSIAVNINNNTFKAGGSLYIGQIAANTATTGDHAVLANGSSYNPVGTVGYFGSSFFNLAQSSNILGNAVGTSSLLVDWKGNGTSSLNKVATSYLTGYTASFDGTTVTITSAVPEPSSYAMLIAGLAAVGFMARRRSSR